MNSATQSFLGRYRLVKVLGQGAMGVVYEAVDTRLNRTVAIKTVLRSHLADETTANEYATRFEREAQAAARLSNPHVVAVYDFGEHEDISYIVMEFVRGRELNQAFEAGETFPLPDAIRIMRELLEALDYAHREGIVHRDVKPANVMLDAGGRVKLTDFGVARVVNANQDRTMPGTLVGTPSYMSPEQILGLAVGSRADIFAAGVILYQFLTGKRPFSGGGPFGVQRKIVQDDPDPPSQVNPAVPSGFDLIISRALAKQPEDRYETAAAFAADLERIGTTLPRDVPRIDLDFSDRPPAAAAPKPPAGPAATPLPPPAAAADGGPGLTLITEVPFGSASPPRAPAPDPNGPPVDPDATVIMFRPTAPDTAARKPPAPPPASTAAAAPSLPLPTRPAPMHSPAPAPRPMPPTAAQIAAEANPPTMAVPRLQPAGGISRSHQPPRRGAGTSTASPARGSGSNARSTLMPLAAGAGVAVLVLAGWLLVARPWADKPGAQTPPPATTPAPTPATPSPSPSPSPVTATDPAPSPAPAPAPAAVEPAPVVVTPPTSMPTPPPADTTPGSRAAPPARQAPTPSTAPSRRPAPEAAPKPPPPTRAEPRSTLEPRCSDLLQRMQLGEPLTADQTMFFQTRCTR